MTVHANHRRIAVSAVVIGVLTIVAKLFVAGREMAIAWRYGVSPTVDAYQLALTIVTWLPMMVISVMVVVLVPRLVALSDTHSEDRRFIGELNGTIFIAGLAFAAVVWAVAPAAAQAFASSTQRSTAHLTTGLSRLMSPVACFLIWTGYISARLQARERFAYTVTEAIPALFIGMAMVAPAILSSETRLGAATSMGFAVQALALIVMLRLAGIPVGGMTFRHKAAEWRSIYRDVGVMALGQVIFAAALPADQLFAARISPGAVAEYGYATRLLTLITALATVVLTRALLPVFSSAIACGESAVAGRQARQWSVLLMIIGAALVAVTWFVADPAVALLFQRGAFTASDVERVAQVLRFGVLQIPFVFGGMALVQLIAAKRSYSTLLWIACVCIVLKLVLNVLLVDRFGLEGLMSATAVMYAFAFAFQFLASVKE